MSRRHRSSPKGLRLILELLGKPIFFLLTFSTVFLLVFSSLISIITHKLKPPKLALPSLSKFWVAFFSLIFLLGALSYGFYYFILRDLPSPTLLSTNLPALSTKIYDRHGILLYQIYRDENRSLVKLSDLPPHLIYATIAGEDKDFYHHRGISLKGIARALMLNINNCFFTNENCSLQGGSTITQQLIKNSLLTSEKTYTRKLKEIVLAFLTESNYSKEEILEYYFNYVPYGGVAFGIEEAARTFFGKSAKDLNLEESALLAGLPVAPTTLSPFGPTPFLAKNRQAQILDSMVEEGYISDNTALVAKSTPLVFRPQRGSILAPHFVMYIKDLLVKELGEDLVNRGGLEVVTTLDLEVQQILETEISTELAKLASLHVGNAAGLITNPATGEILAMAGSSDFFDEGSDGQVNVVLQPRQPGSSIKPITYALAFMRGLTPNSLIEDSPVCFRSTGSPDYCPQNYDGRFHGTITLRTALASSYNVPATKLLNGLGLDAMISLAKNLGITTWNDPTRFGLSLTLGGGEVTMLDMAQVYGTFANNGTRVPLTGIISLKNNLGQDLNFSRSDPIPNVLPSSVSYQISSILSDPLARAPAFGINSILRVPGFEVAVKTGTTNNLRDNWTIGYTPNLLVATWVGNNDNSPMSSVASGITGASPIWSKTFRQLLASSSPTAFSPGNDMIAVSLCPATGRVFCRDTCHTQPKIEYFVPGTEPQSDCQSRSGLIPPAAASEE